jgi:hypothetical protein
MRRASNSRVCRAQRNRCRCPPWRADALRTTPKNGPNPVLSGAFAVKADADAPERSVTAVGSGAELIKSEAICCSIWVLAKAPPLRDGHVLRYLTGRLFSHLPAMSSRTDAPMLTLLREADRSGHTPYLRPTKCLLAQPTASMSAAALLRIPKVFGVSKRSTRHFRRENAELRAKQCSSLCARSSRRRIRTDGS